MNKEKMGTLFAIVTAVISGLSIPLNKMFVVDLDPTVFTAVRALLIGIVFFFITSYKIKFDYRKFKKVSWKYLLAIAVVGGSFAFLLFFSGLKLTTSGRGAFLHKTLPLYVTLFAFVFLKEKISKKQLYALFLMILGTVLLYSSTISPSDLWLNPSLGDIMILGATVLWALENIIARKVMNKGESNFVVSFSRMFFGALILFGIVLLQGNVGLLLSLSTQQIINLLISTAALFGYVFFWYWSVKLINVSKASTLLLIAPVISLVSGFLIFSEPMPGLQIMGSGFILAGAFFLSRIKSRLAEGI